MSQTNEELEKSIQDNRDRIVFLEGAVFALRAVILGGSLAASVDDGRRALLREPNREGEPADPPTAEELYAEMPIDVQRAVSAAGVGDLVLDVIRWVRS